VDPRDYLRVCDAVQERVKACKLQGVWMTSDDPVVAKPRTAASPAPTPPPPEPEPGEPEPEPEPGPAAEVAQPEAVAEVPVVVTDPPAADGEVLASS
jgi:hypothetical protein